MIKKTMVEIKLLEEDGDFVGSYGCFEKQDLYQLVATARKEDMACLSYIDLVRSTYFNMRQCSDIKKELLVLKKYEEIDRMLLNSIEKAVKIAIKNEVYVKFEIVDKQKSI